MGGDITDRQPGIKVWSLLRDKDSSWAIHCENLYMKVIQAGFEKHRSYYIYVAIRVCYPCTQKRLLVSLNLYWLIGGFYLECKQPVCCLEKIFQYGPF